MRLGKTTEISCVEMATRVAIYPLDGPVIIGMLLAVRARVAVLAPWGCRGLLVARRDRIAFAREVELVRPNEQERISATQAMAEYGFLERPPGTIPRANPRRRRRAA